MSAVAGMPPPASAGLFRFTESQDPHRARRRAILRAHPEVAGLCQPQPATILVILGLLLIQLGMAWLVRERSLLTVIAAAYGIGAFAAAGINSMIHEASHGRIFRGRTGNRLAAILANLPCLSVAAMPFFHYHPAHHSSMGDYAMDVGIPTEAEVRWVGARPFRKAMWLAFFPIVQWLRTRKFVAPRTEGNAWTALNAGVQISVDAAILYLWGWTALAYLGLSYWLSVGFHPVGTRVIQEHFFVEEGQETHSYVGPCNLAEMNFGYHVEHHDFPAVPWNRLPRLRRLAPEFYESTFTYRSRVRLMLAFVFGRDWHIGRHTVRIGVKGSERSAA
jgi:sphingolipid delta-4 desaturase